MHSKIMYVWPAKSCPWAAGAPPRSWLELLQGSQPHPPTPTHPPAVLTAPPPHHTRPLPAPQERPAAPAPAAPAARAAPPATMRLAALALACALLAGGASAFTQPAYPIRANVTTKRITNQLVLSSTLQGIINLPALLANGSFQVNPLGKATEKVEVRGRAPPLLPPRPGLGARGPASAPAARTFACRGARARLGAGAPCSPALRGAHAAPLPSRARRGRAGCSRSLRPPTSAAPKPHRAPPPLLPPGDGRRLPRHGHTAAAQLGAAVVRRPRGQGYAVD